MAVELLAGWAYGGIYTFRDANGNTAAIRLGIDWFAWAVLWFLFFAPLALDRPIARLTGYLAIAEGIATAWYSASCSRRAR